MRALAARRHRALPAQLLRRWQPAVQRLDPDGPLTPQTSKSALKRVRENDTAIPAQFRPLIINSLKQAVNNAGNSQQLSSQNVDLTQFANNAPPQFRAQATASLKALGNKITAEFQKGVVQSFTATWLAAAFAAVEGVLLTFFTLVSRRKRRSLKPKSESHEEVDVPAVL